jgi:hypothetical protein
MGFTAPAGAPTTVTNGCLKRPFLYIADKIKTATTYRAWSARISAPKAPRPPHPAPPSSQTSPTGGKLEVLWTKKEFDGVKLEFDPGTAGLKSDLDLRPDYTLN